MAKNEFLKDCMEYKVHKREINMSLILLSFFEVLAFPLVFVDFVKYILMSVVILLITLPFIIYFVSEILTIKKYYNEYEFFEVVLDKVNNSVFRSRVYFTVRITHNQRNYKCDTKSIFSTALMDFIYYPLEEYMNKTVLVAFNPKTEVVLLVKKVR